MRVFSGLTDQIGHEWKQKEGFGGGDYYGIEIKKKNSHETGESNM